ncbi:MAG TPA: hypothetical protein VHA78_03745 [Candidatus Peribacteraceae bacterium]|nr:hypothetical protein [Candidatus Peribacteraceae bacterium]
MKRFLPIIIFLILIPIAMYAGYNRTAKNPDPNHTHADFAVWINGTKLDFSQKKYMQDIPTDEEEQMLEHSTGTGSGPDYFKRYMHLHDGNGDVLHRHKPGLGFGDFLTSLHFTLTPTCLTTDTGEKTCDTADKKWQLFVNGKEIVPFNDNYIFDDGNTILLTYGADSAEVQREESLMTHDACRYSQTCPGRGKAPTESCISDPTVPCKQ